MGSIKTEVKHGSLGNKKGWHFLVYYSAIPGIVSALYKTKKEAQAKLNLYLTTGKWDAYGSAE